MESRTQGHFRYRKSCIERVRDSVYVYLLALILERPYDKTFPFELWISVDRPSLPQGRMREGFFAKQLVLLLERSPGGAAYITAALEYAGPESFEIRLKCRQLTWAPHWCVACIRSHALPTLAVDYCEDCDVGPDVGSSAHPTEILFARFTTWMVFAYFNLLFHKWLSPISVQTIEILSASFSILSTPLEGLVSSIAGIIDSLHNDSR